MALAGSEQLGGLEYLDIPGRAVDGFINFRAAAAFSSCAH